MYRGYTVRVSLLDSVLNHIEVCWLIMVFVLRSEVNKSRGSHDWG